MQFHYQLVIRCNIMLHLIMRSPVSSPGPDDAENTKKRGANNSPRAIVMPYDPDFLVPSVGLEPTLRRF